MIPKILRKFGGIKSQRLATNPRRFCGDVGSKTADCHAGVTVRGRCWALEAGDCYIVLPRIRLFYETLVNKDKKVRPRPGGCARIYEKKAPQPTGPSRSRCVASI
jgi:hypothetical protein